MRDYSALNCVLLNLVVSPTTSKNVFVAFPDFPVYLAVSLTQTPPLKAFRRRSGELHRRALEMAFENEVEVFSPPEVPSGSVSRVSLVPWAGGASRLRRGQVAFCEREQPLHRRSSFCGASTQPSPPRAAFWP